MIKADKYVSNMGSKASSIVLDSLFSVDIVRAHLEKEEPLDNDLRHVLKWLDGFDYVGCDVLVVGCLEEPVSNALAMRGAKVVGVDVREYGKGDFSSGLDKPLYEHVVCDFLDYETDRRFDLVLGISSIEHFGLGYYKDKSDESADYKTLQKIRRLLKPSGRVVITVPYSNVPQVTRHWRSYSKDMLEGMFSGFNVLEQKFFFTGRTGQHDATADDVRCYKQGADLSVMSVLKLGGKNAS